MLEPKANFQSIHSGSWLAETMDMAHKDKDLLALGFFAGFAAFRGALSELLALGFARKQLFFVGPSNVWNGEFHTHWTRPNLGPDLPGFLHWIVADTPPTHDSFVRTQEYLAGRRIADGPQSDAARAIKVMHQSLAPKQMAAMNTHLKQRDGVLIVDQVQSQCEAEVRQTLISHAHRGVQLHDVPSRMTC